MTVNEIEAYYRKYRDKMYFDAFEILQNVHDAEDVVQSVIVKMINNPPQKLDVSSEIAARAYASKAARNTALDVCKKAKNNTSLDMIKELPANTSPSAQLESTELKQCLNAALAGMNERAATILSMKQQGVDDKAIAEALNISVSNVRVTAFRARLRIREQLTKEGLFYE